MNKLIISTIMLTAAAAAASAAVNPDEFPLLEINTDYHIQAYKEFKGKIIAPESGMMIEYNDCPVYLLGTDGELAEIPDRQFAGYINGQQAYQFPVEAATTYYVYTEFAMSDGTIRFAMNPKLAIQGTTPAQNEVLSISRNSFISVMFNQNVNVGNVMVECNGHSEPVEIRINASDLSIPVRDVMAAWYDKGIIAGGETLLVRLDDITNALGEAQDPIELHFIAAPAPAKLLSVTLPEAIASYMPESGPTTRAVFTFSHPMAADPEIELCYAPISDALGYEYTEKIEAKVSGKVITVDFAGKLRASQDMAPSGNRFDSFDLRLFLLRDTDGQYVLSPSEGMLGSFHMQIPYVETEKLDIATQFTPEAGADLDGTDAISIYYTDASAVSYSGVTFTSGNEQITVNTDEITVAYLGNDQAELTVAIPLGWATKENLIVSLADLKVTDGIDHSADFRAKYNGFTLLFASPADGTRQASLAAGSTVTIDTNLKSGDAVSMQISNGDKTVYGPVDMTERYEGAFTHVMQREVILYSGTTYTIEFTAANGVETVSLGGTSSPFEFSPTRLIAISPSEGAAMADNGLIRLEFDGLVSIEPEAGSTDFVASTASDNAEEGFDNTWTLRLGKLSGDEAVVAFKATDQDALIVEGNAGVETQSHFRYVYKVESGILEIVEAAVSADAAIYDLTGRRLPHPSRGINIINGRKILKRQ